MSPSAKDDDDDDEDDVDTDEEEEEELEADADKVDAPWFGSCILAKLVAVRAPGVMDQINRAFRGASISSSSLSDESSATSSSLSTPSSATKPLSFPPEEALLPVTDAVVNLR